MRYTISAALAAAFAVQHVAAHATWQDLWVDGVDYDTQCARQPVSNSPVTDVTSNDMACNAGTSAVSSNCPVTAGSTVTGKCSIVPKKIKGIGIYIKKKLLKLTFPVEMHQQPGDRSCSNEAIGGAHYGPVIVYMAAVADAASATGADSAWFKVFQDTWSANGTSGASDNWGTKDLNTCCGMMDVLIPSDLAPGDYLLRAEAIALHAAGSTGGAQFYMTCYQLTVTGSGAASPDTVSIPGAYSASDSGILINIYQSLTTYDAPGPTVYSGGSTKSAGAACLNCEATCTAGSASTGVANSGGAAAATTSAASSTLASSSAAVTSSAAASSSSSSLSSSSAAVVATSSSSQAVVAAAAPSTTSLSSAAAPVSTSRTSSATASTTSKASCKKRRVRLAKN